MRKSHLLGPSNCRRSICARAGLRRRGAGAPSAQRSVDRLRARALLRRRMPQRRRLANPHAPARPHHQRRLAARRHPRRGRPDARCPPPRNGAAGLVPARSRPGTKFVTLGGAVANDVHGKNHEAAGTFGCHVRRLGLSRSTGEILELSRQAESGAVRRDHRRASGSPASILWVELQLEPIRSAYDRQPRPASSRHRRFLRPAPRRAATGPIRSPGSIAWQAAAALGRGYLHPRPPRRRGRSRRASRAAACAGAARCAGLAAQRPARAGVQSRLSGGAPACSRAKRRMHYDPFFYPLDASGLEPAVWPRGFFQHQSAVPIARRARHLAASCSS